MSQSSNSSSRNGIGFIGLLTLIFITLKLTHVITWSWWWVLSPTLISFALLGLIFLVAFAVFAVAAIMD